MMARKRTARTAARPGLTLRPRVSSLTYTLASQPVYMNTAMRNPAARLPLPPIPLTVNHPLVIGNVPWWWESTSTRPVIAKPIRMTYSISPMPTWIRGDMDADDRNHQADQDVRPRAGGRRAEHREHRRGQDHDAGNHPDQRPGDHQPARHEAQVGVDGPAHPLERGAALRLPQVQPAVGVGDDQHRYRCQHDDRPDCVRGRRRERG